MIMIFFVHIRMERRLKLKVQSNKSSDICVAVNTVYVTGLPSDVEIEEVANFFSDNYALNVPQPRYKVGHHIL